MSISREEVERTARLARLALTAQEKERMVRELGDVLRYAECLRSLPLPEERGAEAPAGGSGLRADEIAPWPGARELTRAAPDVRDDLYRTPPAIEEG